MLEKCCIKPYFVCILDHVVQVPCPRWGWSPQGWALPNPGVTNLFSILKHYKTIHPHRTSVLSTKQWYRVFMSPAGDNSPPSLLPVRADTFYSCLDPACIIVSRMLPRICSPPHSLRVRMISFLPAV